MGKFVVLAGLLIMVVGGLIWALESYTGGRGAVLPGDLVFRRGNFTFYFPIVTSIVLSLVLSVILYLVFGIRR